jgi:hypothetical protein
MLLAIASVSREIYSVKVGGRYIVHFPLESSLKMKCVYFSYELWLWC